MYSAGVEEGLLRRRATALRNIALELWRAALVFVCCSGKNKMTACGKHARNMESADVIMRREKTNILQIEYWLIVFSFNQLIP